MCRLLGILANKPVDFEFSIHRFKEYARDNPDGWGIGWYEGNSSKVFKQGISALNQDSALPALSRQVRSHIIISHVRKGTGTSPSTLNSHPFKYKNWLFAHNGSVEREYLLTLLESRYSKEIKGKTDSEVYFHLILQHIYKSDSTISGIKSAIREVTKESYSGLNFLLANEKELYAFRYSSNSKNYYCLYVLKRDPLKNGPLEFLSKETQLLIQSKSLANEKAILICSEKLTEENWTEVEFGNLLKVDSNLTVSEAKIL